MSSRIEMRQRDICRINSFMSTLIIRIHGQRPARFVQKFYPKVACLPNKVLGSLRMVNIRLLTLNFCYSAKALRRILLKISLNWLSLQESQRGHTSQQTRAIYKSSRMGSSTDSALTSSLGGAAR